VTLQEWDKLWAINKRIIDPVCPRHTAVRAAGRVRLRLGNGPAEPEVVTVPKHKKHPPAGVKASTRTQVRQFRSTSLCCLVGPTPVCRFSVAGLRLWRCASACLDRLLGDPSWHTVIHVRQMQRRGMLFLHAIAWVTRVTVIYLVGDLHIKWRRLCGRMSTCIILRKAMSSIGPCAGDMAGAGGCAADQRWGRGHSHGLGQCHRAGVSCLHARTRKHMHPHMSSFTKSMQVFSRPMRDCKWDVCFPTSSSFLM
jgi:hypothetical protein